MTGGPRPANTEHALLSILRHRLVEPEMGADDDFYAMGGDSLIALRVVADAIRRGIPLELRDILFHPTAHGMSAALAEGTRSPADDDAGTPAVLDAVDRSLVPAGVTRTRPVSALQLGLLYLCETAQDPGLYHDLVGVEVFERFDEEAFAAALADLCRRHDALRSSFDIGGFSQPLELVWADVTPSLTVERPAGAEAAGRWRRVELARRFDHERAPLLRCHVAVAPTSFHLTLAAHHAVLDGWSYARVVTELLLRYAAALAGRTVALPTPPPDGYDRFLALERAAAADAGTADFWQAEADVAPLLFRRGAFAGPAAATGTLTRPLTARTLAGLQDTAATLGVPVKSLVLGAHAGALGTLAGRTTDVVTGLTVNGRPETPGADLLVGLFLNTVPLRFRSVDHTTADLARTALELERRALPHRRYPLARIEQRLGRPSFDVLFNYTHFHGYRDLERHGPRTGSWWSFDRTSIPVVVDFMVESRRAGTAVEITHDPALLPPGRAREYAELFEDALRAAASGPRR